MEITRTQIDQAMYKLEEDQRVSGGDVQVQDWIIIVHPEYYLKATFTDGSSREVDIKKLDRFLRGE
jgi:hypothetical protein